MSHRIARPSFWLATALLFWAPPFAEAAQPPPKIEVGSKMKTRGEGANAKAEQVLVAAARFKPRAEPRLTAAPFGDKMYNYLEEAFVAYDDQDTRFCFLAIPNADWTVKEPLGWVPSDLLVRGGWRAIRQIARDEKGGEKKDENGKVIESAITLKAVIVNTEESLNASRVYLTLPAEFEADLSQTAVSPRIRQEFKTIRQLDLSPNAMVQKPVAAPGEAREWLIVDEGQDRFYRFEVRSTKEGLIVADSYGMAPVDDTPVSTDGPVRRTGFRLANTFFVFAKYGKDPKDQTRPTHYLLGLNSYIPGVKQPASVIKGWVPAHRVREWDTGEALRWDRGPETKDREPGVVFGDEESANDWWKGKTVEPIITEDPKVPWAPVTPRLLLIDGKSIEQGDDPATLFRVLTPGVANTQRKGVTAPSSAQVGSKVNLERAQREIKNLDLVFVIDDSQSMQRCFKPVGRVVEEVLRQALQSRQKLLDSKTGELTPGTVSRLRVSVTFYSDRPAGRSVIPLGAPPSKESDPKPKWEMKVIFKPETSDAEALKNIRDLVGDDAGLDKKSIKGHEFRPGGDPPEQLFEGIYTAADEIKAELAQAPLARRVMILVGDMASHPLQDGKGKDLSDEQSIALLVRKLTPSGDGENPFEFYAVRVEEDDTIPGQRHEDAIRMRAQMLTLCNALNQAERQRVKRASPSLTDDDLKKIVVARFFPDGPAQAPEASLPLVKVADLSATLRTRFDAIREQQEMVLRDITDLRTGEWPANPNQLSEATLRLLASLGENAADFAKRDAAEVYLGGYVWRHVRVVGGGKGPRQLRTEFRLSEGELFAVIKALEAFAGAPRDVLETPEALQKLYREQLKDLAREKEQFKDFREAFDSRFGIKSLTTFLKKSEKELTTGLKANSEEVAQLRMKVELLKDRLANQTRESIVDGKSRKIQVVKTKAGGFDLDLPDAIKLETPNYFTQPGGDEKFFWVPIEELP